MPFIPIPGAAEVVMRFTQDNQNVINTFGVQVQDETASGLDVIASVFGNWWQVFMKPLCSNTLVLQSVEVTDLTDEISPQGTYTTGLPDEGSIVLSQAMPNNVTLCVSLRTALRGRSYRGRSYVLGAVEDQVQGNHFTAEYITDVLDAYNQLRTNLIAEGAALSILSRYTNNAPRATGIATEVTSILVTDDVVDSQRRRLPGRGR